MLKNNIKEDDISIGSSNITNIGGDTQKNAIPTNKPDTSKAPVPTPPKTGQVGYSSLKDTNPEQSDGKTTPSVSNASANTNVDKKSQSTAVPAPVKEGEEQINKTVIQKKIDELISLAQPDKKEELMKLQLVRDSLIPFERSQYSEFGKYFNNAPDDEMNKMIKAANTDKFYFDKTAAEIESFKKASPIKEDTERPEPEEHWNNRQFDDINRQEDNLNDERDGIIPDNIYEDPEVNDMYVEYLKDMQGEEPFMKGDKKYQYVWAKYPDGKKDVGVYAYAGDVCYSNDYFRNTILNLKEDVSEDSTESSTQKPIKFAIAYIENGKKSWLIKIDNNRTDWDWAERPFKLESNVMKFNSFEEANNIAKHMRSPSHKVIVVDSNGKQYTNDGVTEESNLKGGYVKSKLKEDAFSTNGNTSGTDDVSKALGGIKGTEAVTRLIRKLKQTPDLVNLMKNIKTPEDKQIVAVELDKMLNLPATTIPRVGKALNTVIGAEDKLNVSKTAAESVNAKMSKANIIEFVNKLKPRRAVKEKVTIKELNEKSIPMNVKSFKAKLDELSTKPSEEFNSNNSWGFGGAAGTKYHIGNLVVKVAVATQRHTGNFPFITITDVDGRRIFDEEQNSKTFAIALNTINKLLNK